MRIWPTKRWWKRFAIGAAIVVALALIANGFMAWRAEHRLRAMIDSLRAAGEPASIADLTPASVPEDQDAAVIIKSISNDLEAFSKEYGAFYSSPAGKDWSTREDADQPPTDEQFAMMQTILDAYPKILPALAAASVCNDYTSQLDFTLPPSQFIEAMLPHVQEIRTLARYVAWKTAILNAAGKQDESVRLGVQLLRLARLYDREPMLLSYLVSIAVRGIAVDSINKSLQSGPIDADLRRELEAELMAQDNSQALSRVLQSERAYGIASTIEHTQAVPSQLRWPMSNYFWQELLVLDRAVVSVGKPWYTIRGEWDASSARDTQQIQLAGLNEKTLAGESLRALFVADARRLALARCLRILNALQTYAGERGQEANTLDDLGLPSEAAIDPFSGEPLKLKHTDEGWIVYSVMDNGVDDGGDFKELKDYGLAPAKLRGTE